MSMFNMFEPDKESEKQEETKHKQAPAPPVYQFDAKQPYGIVLDKWDEFQKGNQDYINKQIESNNRNIKTQGIAEMLRLVGEGITGSMGSDIIKRGQNPYLTKLEKDNDKLKNLLFDQKTKDNAMQLQMMMKNLDYDLKGKDDADKINFNNATQEYWYNRNKDDAEDLYEQEKIDAKKQAETNFNRRKDLIREQGKETRKNYSVRGGGYGGNKGYTLEDFAGVKRKIDPRIYDVLYQNALATLSEDEKNVLKTGWEWEADGVGRKLRNTILDLYHNAINSTSQNAEEETTTQEEQELPYVNNPLNINDYIGDDFYIDEEEQEQELQKPSHKEPKSPYYGQFILNK